MSATSVKRTINEVIQGGTATQPAVVNKTAFERVAKVAKRTSGVDNKERAVISTFVQGAAKPESTYTFDTSGNRAAAAFMESYPLCESGEIVNAKSLPKPLVKSVGEHVKTRASSGDEGFPQASDGYYDGITGHMQAGPDAKVLADWLKKAAQERSGARPGSAVWNVIPDDFDSKKQELLVVTYGWDEKEVHVSIVDVDTGKISKGVSLNTVDLGESDDIDAADQIDEMLNTAIVAAHIETEDS